MKITQEVRDYAKKNNLQETDAINEGLKEKAKEFNNKGGKIYGSSS